MGLFNKLFGKTNFNEKELLKIKQAISGLHNEEARKTVAQALLVMKPLIDDAKKLNDKERKEALKILVNEATDARHAALQSGGRSYGHPQWAAAAACESWLHELFSGTPESILKVEQLIVQLSNRG